MLDSLIGLYLHNKINARRVDIVFKETLIPDSTGTLVLTGASNGAALKDNLSAKDYLITDMVYYCSPGIVNMKIVPDNDTSFTYTIDVSSDVVRERLSMPFVVLTDLTVDYVNESQVNNIYLRLSGIQFANNMLDDLITISYSFVENLNSMDMTLVEILKSLVNIQSVQSGGKPVYDVSVESKRASGYRMRCRR